MKRKFTAVLFLGGPMTLTKKAELFCRERFRVLHVSTYQRSTKKLTAQAQRSVQRNDIDYLFNFLSPVIIPMSILSKIRRYAINFHPAPPKWPGVGGASYALYAEDKTFGVTAHIMEEKVDSGQIIQTLRFPIQKTDFCDTLFDRALAHTFLLYQKILNEIATTGSLTFSRQQWKRRAGTRIQFERWMVINSSDSSEEIRRKIHAVHHATFPGPFIDVEGHRFELPPRGKK